MTVRLGETARGDADWTVDCRGFAARDMLFGLRGVKGEMLVLRAHDFWHSRAPFACSTPNAQSTSCHVATDCSWSARR